ncbi:DoxX family protein [Mesobacillus maritimus]|uniref:DoxX family protein n=1 Tax=Mesobacillus maritimus TaxID=1643336 RepID=A0ABS7K7B6_9BACI|nr:DoxX family protein [Mesobacillus maritimus]MBY0098157.1 DoxX family protein [Mesobacillus maritimus]
MKNKLAWSTLILRVVLGITFFLHGLDKFSAGIGNTVRWFESIGLPGSLAYAVAVIELVGGLLVVVGLGSKIVSALLAVIMLGAIFTAKLSMGFLNGYEFDIALLAMAVFIAVNGSQMLAIDSVIKGKKEQNHSQAA